MVVQDKRLEKLCCFYVSDYHLEMILVPYIINKINEKIIVLTQNNLEETMEILMSKLNLKEEVKEKILNINWNDQKEIEENSNIIIIGTNEFIKEKNNEIKNMDLISILDCYDFNEEKDNINHITKKYSGTLNTLGKKYF